MQQMLQDGLADCNRTRVFNYTAVLVFDSQASMTSPPPTAISGLLAAATADRAVQVVRIPSHLGEQFLEKQEY